jgi:hypothetical protein
MYSFKFAKVGEHVTVSMLVGEFWIKEAAFIYDVYSGDPKVSIAYERPMSIAALSVMLDELSIWLEVWASKNPPGTTD